MVILLARGDVDRCSQFTRQRGGAGRRGCWCCCSIYSKTPWLFTFVHFSLCHPTEVHQDRVSASLSRIAVIEQQCFLFYPGTFELLPGRFSSKHRRKCWLSLWGKEGAISGFPLKNELSFAAALTEENYSLLFFLSHQDEKTCPYCLSPWEDAQWRKGQQFPALWEGGRKGTARLPSALPLSLQPGLSSAHLDPDSLSEPPVLLPGKPEEILQGKSSQKCGPDFAVLLD